MYRRLSLAGASVLFVLVGCSNKRDLGAFPDGGGATTGMGGAAGAAGGGAGGQGGEGGGAVGTGGGAGGSSAGAGGTGGAPETGGTGGSGGAGGAAAGTGGGGTGGATGGTGGATGGTGGIARRCDPTKPFGTPTLVPNVNTSSEEDGAVLADDLTLYLISNRPGGAGGLDIYVATRDSVQNVFRAAQPLAGINSPGGELWPQLTRDQRTMFYAYAAPASPVGDIYVTTRSSPAVAFAPGSPVAQVNSTSDDGDLFLWRDGEALYFISSRTGSIGSMDIYVSVRRTDGSYGLAEPISELNTAEHDGHPVVLPDGLTIYWGSHRPDGGGARGNEVWRATRSSTSAPFSNLARVSELNTDAADAPTWVTPDECHIYLTSTRPGGIGGQDIWEATRPL